MYALHRLGLGKRTSGSQCVGGGDYLTDGYRLLRVVWRMDPRAEHRFAVLEDCKTLELDAYAPDELAGMGLRPVLRHAEGSPELTTTTTLQ